MKPYSDNWRTICRLAMGVTLNETQAPMMEWWFTSAARMMLILGGERAGKSLMAAYALMATMDIGKKGEYWIVGPDYQQARQEFLYLYAAFSAGANKISFLEPSSVSMPTSIASPWSFTTIWGQEVRTRSASDIQKLASFSVSGVIMAEAAQQIYESYLKLLGRVSETSGPLILSGTLERGLPWYGDMYTRWQGENDLEARSFSLPTWSNTDVYPGGIENDRIQELRSEYPEDLFMERFGAMPTRKFGLVIPEFDMKTHVKHLEFDENEPVELAIDPGQHTYAVLFVQHIGPKTHVLDAIYEHGMIVQEIIPKVMAHRLWKHVDKRRAGIIDNAAKQHNAQKSQIELWAEIAGVTLHGNYCRLDDTINTVRFRLLANNQWHEPLVYFNDHLRNNKTPAGLALDILAEFELWVWPTRAPGRNAPMVPIDKNNDAIKALGYKLIDRYGLNVERKLNAKGRRRAYMV